MLTIHSDRIDGKQLKKQKHNNQNRNNIIQFAVRGGIEVLLLCDINFSVTGPLRCVEELFVDVISSLSA